MAAKYSAKTSEKCLAYISRALEKLYVIFIKLREISGTLKS